MDSCFIAVEKNILYKNIDVEDIIDIVKLIEIY